ncbi:uncharacterized protein LOC112049727 [Bicyclus anynana]|uniref:Uncharacterized protein LOC112049727 n=1 Tax=Bicyclus anynana TaxID=110368 RepID=A0A6J1NK42_BICAN|nr:uncharacterized protein LOC112049727 [Bicyclus anynana]
MENCPSELLLLIFSSLHPRQLTRCRRVCRRWYTMIECILRNENMWKAHCLKEFEDVYQKKRLSGLTWRKLYRSLNLWTKLLSATETQLIAFTSFFCEEIYGFQLLTNGIIGLHRKNCIVYHDIHTLEYELSLLPMFGNYTRYVENDETIVLLEHQANLTIIRKVLKDAQHVRQIVFSNIKNFLLKTDEVYIITVDNKIYVCNLHDEKLKSTFVMRLTANILCVEYVNRCLNVLTANKHILVISGRRLISQFKLNDNCNTLHILKQYNLLQNLSWSNYVVNNWYTWINPKVVKIYGDFVFVGTNFGFLKIYRSPYVNKEFDLVTSRPIRQYRLPCSPSHQFQNHIRHIDVLEEEDGHSVFISTSEKLVVIKFSHNVSEDGLLI